MWGLGTQFEEKVIWPRPTDNVDIFEMSVRDRGKNHRHFICVPFYYYANEEKKRNVEIKCLHKNKGIPVADEREHEMQMMFEASSFIPENY